MGIAATGGTFALQVQGESTSSLPWDATDAEVEAAIDALPAVGGVGAAATVTGGPGDEHGTHPYETAIGGGGLSGREVSFSVNTSLLEGPGHGVTSFTTVQKGKAVDQYTLVPINVGTRASTGKITVTDTLPAGVTVVGTEAVLRKEANNEFIQWECATEGVAGHAVVTCTTENSVPALTPAIGVAIHLAVPPGAVGTLENHVQISGGGALAPAVAQSLTPIDAPPAPFGVLEGFDASLLNAAGEPDTTAGDHPGAQATSFVFPTAYLVIPNGSGPTRRPTSVENVKQIVTDLPAGVIGDALAASTCSLSDITNLVYGPEVCPASSHVGTLALIQQQGGSVAELPIFNVTPERGYPAEFAVFEPAYQRAVLLYASVVGSGASAHVRIITGPQNTIAEEVGISVTFFGHPAAIDGTMPEKAAFLTSPSDCSAAGFTSSIHVDSWQHPGRVEADGQPDLSDPNWKSATSVSSPVRGCEALQFHPSLSFAPEEAQRQADEPAGYESVLRIPQNDDPNGLATPPLKQAVVTLPAGVAISPGVADGLVGCQETGTEGLEPQSPDPGHCPAASTVGSAEVVTPLLQEPLEGSVYVAQPACGGQGQPGCSEEAGETGGVFALYLEVGSETSGVHLKLKGKVEVGGNGQHSHETGLAPGQIRTTFADAPQQPFSELRLHFNSGPRAPLANPQDCGAFQASSELEAWSHQPAPGEAAGTANTSGPSPAFTVGGCENKFTPSFTAGTLNPQAGGYSPLLVTFSRQDREQDLSGVTVSLPPGLLGKIAGVPLCPDAQAQAGSCSASSRIGSATAAAGSGSHPLWQPGNVYLTGPYKGAPFGLSIVVPANAGPFHLGNIVARAAIEIDPHTAQITVVSDPLPQSIDGVPLRIQTINTTIDRAGFSFNPTNCNPLSVDGTLTGSAGASASVASHFQAANCAGLPFKPSFKVATQARTSKKGGASLDVKVGSSMGQANIAKVAVSLPKQLPARLTTIQQACPQATFAANPASCPAGSNIGIAMARTPILAAPLTGPAYLVSHGGAAFPDLVLILQGEGITLDLVGSIDIKKGVTSSTFASVPDAPISSFELKLPEGPHSGLAAIVPAKAKGSLCGTSLAMPTTITGQNGAQIKQSTKIAVTGCPKAKKKTKHNKHKKKRKK